MPEVYNDPEAASSTSHPAGVCQICYEEFLLEDGKQGNGSLFGSEVLMQYLDLEAATLFCCSVGGDYDPKPLNTVEGGKRVGKPDPTKQRIRVPGCGHEFCHDCLVQQCKHSISERRVPIPCPSRSKRGSTNEIESHNLSSELVRYLLSTGETVHDDGDATATSSLWKQFERLQLLHFDPTLLSCPRCDGLVKPKPHALSSTHQVNNPQFQTEETGGKSITANQSNGERGHDDSNADECNGSVDTNQVTCPACQREFCTIHGDAHFGKTCDEFFQARHDDEASKLSERAISKVAKPCSHQCGALIIRASGCDHIICPVCHQDMCYKCGTHEFLSGKVVRNCEKCRQGYIDHRHYNQYRLRLLLIVPFHLAVSAVYIAFMGTVSIITFGFCCCFGCGALTWDCRRLEPRQSKSSNTLPAQEQPLPLPTESRQPVSPNNYNPLRGACLVTKVICYPILELARDCGLIHGPILGDESDSDQVDSHEEDGANT